MLTGNAKVNKDITALFKARNAILWIVTREELRVERAVTEAAGAAGFPVRLWDCADGITSVDKDGKSVSLLASGDPLAALSAKIDQLAQSIGQGGQNGQGGQGAKPKGAGKIDPAQVQTYMQRNQKLLTHLYSSLGIPLPHDILDEPKPDDQGGGDSKGGGSSSSGSGGGSSGGTDKKAENPTGIKPIQPIQPFGGAKTASVAEKAAAMLAIHRKLNL